MGYVGILLYTQSLFKGDYKPKTGAGKPKSSAAGNWTRSGLLAAAAERKAGEGLGFRVSDLWVRL